MSPVEHALQALVVVLVLVKLWALGRKYRWGWAMAVAAEVPWLTLAILWGSWGMVALSVLYGGFSARNWWAWRPKRIALEAPISLGSYRTR